MKRLIIIELIVVIISSTSGLLAQSKSTDTIRVHLAIGIDKSPFPGANFLIKGTTIGTVSDINGNTTLNVPADKDKVVISIMGPYIELSILRPVDSIYFDLGTKKATYFLKGTKIRTRKQIIR